MKKILFIVLALACGYAHAQRIKYKDLVVVLPSYSQEQQKTELKDYLINDLDHPNANFRLALLYERNYKNSDPLAQYEFVIANAEQARIRFFKSKQVVDEREVNRNNEYYSPIFKMYDAKGNLSVPYLTVSNKMNAGFDSAELFLKKMPSIYHCFTKSVNFYDDAVKTFAKINSEFNSPEELYLLFNSDLDKRFTHLKSSYDSCIRFLDQYIQLSKEFPLRGHRPTYKVNTISTYRLDGLITRLNFLTDRIDLWNYGTWVDQVRKTVATDIASLRQSVENNHTKLDEVLNKIAVSTADQLPTPHTLDKQLIFNLNHFDRQSAVLSLLEYKAYKQWWDVQHRGKTLDTTFSIRNAEVYSSLIYFNRKADTLARDLKTRATQAQTARHIDFVTKIFGGQPGFEKYIAAEQTGIQKSFDEYTSQVRENLAHLATATEGFTNKDNIIKSGRFSIPLVAQPVVAEALDQGILFTKFNRKNPDGSAYVAGIYKPDKKKNLISTYLVRINPDGKVGWFKDFAISVDSAAVGDAHSYLGPIALTQEGSAFVIRSIHATRGDAANTFVYLNEKGEEKLRKRLAETAYPRFIQYSEKSNSFVLTLKGNEETQNYATSENVTLVSVNALGESTWKRELELTGTVVDLISLVDGYMLAGNYMVLRDHTGKEFRTRIANNECNPFVTKLNERGEVVTIRPIEAPGSNYLQRVVKINDNSINLLAYPEKLDVALTNPFSNTDKVTHVMTNRQTQIVCTSY